MVKMGTFGVSSAVLVMSMMCLNWTRAAPVVDKDSATVSYLSINILVLEVFQFVIMVIMYKLGFSEEQLQLTSTNSFYHLF